MHGASEGDLRAVGKSSSRAFKRREDRVVRRRESTCSQCIIEGTTRVHNIRREFWLVTSSHCARFWRKQNRWTPWRREFSNRFGFAQNGHNARKLWAKGTTAFFKLIFGRNQIQNQLGRASKSNMSPDSHVVENLIQDNRPRGRTDPKAKDKEYKKEKRVVKIV